MDPLTRAKLVLARKRAHSTHVGYSGPIPEWPMAGQGFPEDELIYVAVNRERAGVVEVRDADGHLIRRQHGQTVGEIRSACSAVNRWWWALPEERRFPMRVPTL